MECIVIHQKIHSKDDHIIVTCRKSYSSTRHIPAICIHFWTQVSLRAVHLRSLKSNICIC